MPIIIFNGKSYSDPNAMPPDVRQAYEQALGLLADKNQNGLPDMMEGMFGPADAQGSPVASANFIMAEGQSYARVADMPPDVRQRYEQAMAQMPAPFAANQIVADGKVYNSVDELPPELRQKYTQAMAKMNAVLGDANQNGVPDIMEGAMAAAANPAATANPLPPNTSASVISETTPNARGGLLLLAGLGLVVLVLVLVLVVLPMFK